MPPLSTLISHTLDTPRMTLTLFDHSKAEYDFCLSIMNSPEAYASMGDYGIRTREQLDALNTSSALHPEVLTAFHKPSDTNGSDVASLSPLTMDVFSMYMMRSKETHALIGGVSIAQRSATLPPDIGWVLDPAHFGKGYAAEAAAEFLRVVRDDWGIKEVIAWPKASNMASRRIAEKIGMVLGANVKDGDGNEGVVYVLPGMDATAMEGKVIRLEGDGDSAR